MICSYLNVACECPLETIEDLTHTEEAHSLYESECVGMNTITPTKEKQHKTMFTYVHLYGTLPSVFIKQPTFGGTSLFESLLSSLVVYQMRERGRQPNKINI